VQRLPIFCRFSLVGMNAVVVSSLSCVFARVISVASLAVSPPRSLPRVSVRQATPLHPFASIILINPSFTLPVLSILLSYIFNTCHTLPSHRSNISTPHLRCATESCASTRMPHFGDHAKRGAVWPIHKRCGPQSSRDPHASVIHTVEGSEDGRR
jgi:hypothetical protein